MVRLVDMKAVIPLLQIQHEDEDEDLVTPPSHLSALADPISD